MSMDKKEHTFAILAYKESPYLVECIDSIKRQTMPSEVFIATSTSSQFLDRISRKSNIALYVNTAQEGIASDWSFAYKKARSKYLTLAHQDDIYLPQYTQQCIAKTRRHNDCLIVFPDYFELINGGKKGLSVKLAIKRLLLLAFFLKPSIRSCLIRRLVLSFGTPIQCSSVMYHKDAIGDFEFSKNFRCNMDWDAWLRLAQKKGSFVFVNQKLMCHRLHKDSQTYRMIVKKDRQKEEQLIFERLWPKSIARLLSCLYSHASHLYKKIGEEC